MGYVPLNNYKHDGGYRRIQSGPNHQGFIVLTSGSTAYGANEGIVVAGSPLSGTPTLGAWDYDSNWRYVPSTLASQSGSLDPTPYNVSGALDTYNATRIYTRNTVAGAQAASAIGPETGKVNPRGGQPERYMYFGGAAPDNQDYSPYNTPDANSAAEGKTGGGVTHKAYESSLLTNVLGSQGTSDRSQWRYHQPVYCKTYTETRRSETPGLMSTPLRYVYRGSASSWGSASSLGPVGSYNYNYGSELLANRGGFEQLFDDNLPSTVPGSGTLIFSTPLYVDSAVQITPSCAGARISWYRVDPYTEERTFITQNTTSYTLTMADENYLIEGDVECPDPYSSTGYGPAGVAGRTPVVAFNPYVYTYARYSGNWFSASVTPLTNIITPWLLVRSPALPSGRYFAWIVGEAGNCRRDQRILPCEELIAWANNYTIELDGSLVGWCINSPRRLPLYKGQDNYTNINYFNPEGGIRSAACVNLGEVRFYASMSGIYEFSNDQSTVIRRWNGVGNPR